MMPLATSLAGFWLAGAPDHDRDPHNDANHRLIPPLQAKIFERKRLLSASPDWGMEITLEDHLHAATPVMAR
jgi:hypothetical protein